MSKLNIVATLVAKPEAADPLRDLLLQATPAFRDENGCLSYTLLEDQKQPGRFMTFETWQDEAALQAHMNTPAMAQMKPRLADLLASDMTQDFLTPLLVL